MERSIKDETWERVTHSKSRGLNENSTIAQLSNIGELNAQNMGHTAAQCEEFNCLRGRPVELQKWNNGNNSPIPEEPKRGKLKVEEREEQVKKKQESKN